MKRTANKFQRAYMVAKARVQEVESQQEAIEKKFIADKGIVNPDGSVPEFLYCMEDDAAFEKANDEGPGRIRVSFKTVQGSVSWDTCYTPCGMCPAFNYTSITYPC